MSTRSKYRLLSGWKARKDRVCKRVGSSFLVQGHWPDELVIDAFDANVAKHPDKAAITDYYNPGASSFGGIPGGRMTLTFRQLQKLSFRFACGLVHYGIGKSDFIALQLPNWWHMVALHLAAVRIGAITVPMMPIFREKELSFMLPFSGTKMIFVPKKWRGWDHQQMLRGLRKDCPDLKHVFAIGAEAGDPESFEECFLNTAWETQVDAQQLFQQRRPAPNDPILLAYTSGTTGVPKGACRSVCGCVGVWGGSFVFGWDALKNYTLP